MPTLRASPVDLRRKGSTSVWKKQTLQQSVSSPLTSLSPAGSEQTRSLFWHSWLKYSKVIMVDIQARSFGNIYNNIEIEYLKQPETPHTDILPRQHDSKQSRPKIPFFHNDWVDRAADRVSYTHCLRDLLVLKALEVAMLVHAVHHCAALWFYPALRHQVQLGVHIYSLHLGVIVIISGKAAVPWQKNSCLLCISFCLNVGSQCSRPHIHRLVADGNM